MDRLTKKLCQTTVYVGEESKHLNPAELSVGQTREVLQKLCEYEETGLSPDEVVELKKSADIKVKNQRTNIRYSKTYGIKTKGIKIRFAHQRKKVLSSGFGTLPYRRNCKCGYLQT